MKNLNLKNSLRFFRGSSGFDFLPDGSLLPKRFSAQNDWSGYRGIGFMRECSSGIRFLCRTNAAHWKMRVRLGVCEFEFGRGAFDVFCNNKYLLTAAPPAPYTPDQIFEWECLLPEGKDKVLTVYFPTYRKCIVESIETDADVMEELPPLRNRILFVGDSITQGYGTTPAFCYAARYARKTNSDYLNTGIGGATMPSGLPDALAEGSFTEAFLSFGTNDCNCKRCVPEIVESLKKSLAFFAEKMPDIPLNVLSPVPWPVGYEKGLRRIHDDISDAILNTASAFPGVRTLDGRRLFPENPCRFVDGIHPDTAGHRDIAENLFRRLHSPSESVKSRPTPSIR